VDNNGATDIGQLTIHVGPRYLFVDASFAGAPKDGRDTNPFQTLQQAETGSAANDTFVVKQGAYTDFITLKNGQIMYGNGASASARPTRCPRSSSTTVRSRRRSRPSTPPPA